MDFQKKYLKYKLKYIEQNIMSNLETQNKKFVKSLEDITKPIYELTPNNARLVLSNLQSDSVDKLPADILDIEIPYKNKKVSVRIVKPINHQNKK